MEHSKSNISTTMPSNSSPARKTFSIYTKQVIQSTQEEDGEQLATKTTSQQPTIQIDHLSTDSVVHTTSIPSCSSTRFSSPPTTLNSIILENPTSIPPSNPTNNDSHNSSSSLSPTNHTPLPIQSNVTSSSSWTYGPSTFLHFMNTQFPSIQQQARRHKKTIVYQKKGTTGMAGQITGVCDSLLLAILHKRPFQSKFFIHHHSIFHFTISGRSCSSFFLLLIPSSPSPLSLSYSS